MWITELMRFGFVVRKSSLLVFLSFGLFGLGIISEVTRVYSRLHSRILLSGARTQTLFGYKQNKCPNCFIISQSCLVGCMLASLATKYQKYLLLKDIQPLLNVLWRAKSLIENPWNRAMVLKLRVHQNHLEGLLKHRLLVINFRVLIQWT